MEDIKNLITIATDKAIAKIDNNDILEICTNLTNCILEKNIQNIYFYISTDDKLTIAYNKNLVPIDAYKTNCTYLIQMYRDGDFKQVSDLKNALCDELSLMISTCNY